MQRIPRSPIRDGGAAHVIKPATFNVGGVPPGIPRAARYALGAAPVRSWRPDFAPHNPWLVGQSVRLQRSGQTILSGSAQMPGYAYGTFKPLYPGNRGIAFLRWLAPYTIPVQPSHRNQIHPRWNNRVVSGDPHNRRLVRGVMTEIPTRSHRFDNIVQSYLANSSLRTIGAGRYDGS